jgi:tetratricopeptide (TPR) repeat protein
MAAVLTLAALTASAQERASVRALLEQARVQSAAGDPPAALALLGQARALAPNAEVVLSAYAQVALAARLPVHAIDVLDPLTRLCPGVAEYHHLLGVAYMQVGGMEQAVLALREADRVEPNRVTTLAALGLALNSRKLHADAEPFLRRALAFEPEHPDVLAALAETEEALGDAQQAEMHASRALERAPGHAAAHFVIGVLRMKQARYGEARDALLRAIAAQPDLAKAHYQASLAFARLGDEASAAKHVELYQQTLRDMEAALKKVRAR